MDAKKVASFLLLRPAFSGRNLVSLVLVMIFFGVYVASGGRVTTMPKVKSGPGFGTVDALPAPARETETEVEQDEPSKSDVSSQGMLFRGRSKPATEEVEKDEIQPTVKVPGSAPSRDRFAEMRDRLNKLKAQNQQK